MTFLFEQLQSGRFSLADALQLINSVEVQRLENKATIVFGENHFGPFLSGVPRLE